MEIYLRKNCHEQISATFRNILRLRQLVFPLKMFFSQYVEERSFKESNNAFISNFTTIDARDFFYESTTFYPFIQFLFALNVNDAARYCGWFHVES